MTRSNAERILGMIGLVMAVALVSPAVVDASALDTTSSSVCYSDDSTASSCTEVWCETFENGADCGTDSYHDPDCQGHPCADP